MRVQVSIREIMDHGDWLAYCEMTGMSEWAVKDGRCDSSEIVTLTPDQVKRANLNGWITRQLNK